MSGQNMSETGTEQGTAGIAMAEEFEVLRLKLNLVKLAKSGPAVEPEPVFAPWSVPDLGFVLLALSNSEAEHEKQSAGVGFWLGWKPVLELEMKAALVHSVAGGMGIDMDTIEFEFG